MNRLSRNLRTVINDIDFAVCCKTSTVYGDCHFATRGQRRRNHIRNHHLLRCGEEVVGRCRVAFENDIHLGRAFGNPEHHAVARGHGRARGGRDGARPSRHETEAIRYTNSGRNVELHHSVIVILAEGELENGRRAAVDHAFARY